MVDVVSRLPSFALFSMDSVDSLNTRVQDLGEIYGAYLRGGLVAYTVLAFPGVGSSNLGREFGVPESELLRVAILDATVVHESARGQGLQRQFHELREDRARAYGCLHLFSTVHPDNHVSRRNLEAAGFTVQFTRPMYEGHPRHCYAKRLI
ncbi:GNAT family N-acetyltransferase [Paenibacillus sp. LMG 31456]|uniref:GNAT family N-acetyltransferase n=2 Tax=Paenibacillus foliorum TaxID=2654974 RepID=A0A972GMT3_9BACL|nr:GNAT family N-acetyltransferase [Paenibacillus foliorum]